MKGTVNESHFHHLGVSTADFVKEESLDDNSLFLLELKLPYSPRFAVCLDGIKIEQIYITSEPRRD